MKIAWIGYLDDPNSYWDDVRRMAEIGYQALESTDLLLAGDVEENARRLRSYGLSVLSFSVELDKVRAEGIDGYLKLACQLQAPNATAYCSAVNASFWNRPVVYDECMRDIELMEQLAERFALEGIQFCYHNHYQDFTVRFDGEPFFDKLIRSTSRLKIELDTGWVQNSLENPVWIMERIAPRLQMIHVKDYRNGGLRADGSGYAPVFTAVGTGELPLRGVVEAAEALGVEWIVAEQDKMRNLTAVESLTCAYLNIREYMQK